MTDIFNLLIYFNKPLGALELAKTKKSFRKSQKINISNALTNFLTAITLKGCLKHFPRPGN